MIQTGTDRVEPFTCVACMLAKVKDLPTQAEDRRAPGETAGILTLGSFGHQNIGAEHVAIKTNAALQAGHRNSEVMQSGQPRTG